MRFRHISARRVMVDILEPRTLLTAALNVAWMEYGSHLIRHQEVGGAGSTLYSAGSEPIVRNLTAVAGGQIYWAESNDLPSNGPVDGSHATGVIKRMNSDGSGVTTILTITEPDRVQASLTGIAVDLAGGKIYWADQTDFGHSSTINRANLDGTAPEVLLNGSSAGKPLDLALDVPHGKMYWTNLVSDTVYSANLDGTNPKLIIDGPYAGRISASGIAVDSAGGKLYLTDRNGYAPNYTYKIITANLDGTGIADLITTGLNGPAGIAIDTASGVGFTADTNSGQILQFNLDGTGSPATISPAATPLGITIVPDPSATAILLSPPPAQSATATRSANFNLGRIFAVNAAGELKVTVNWGDGSSPSEVPVTANGVLPVTAHTYASAGTFKVTVVGSDSSGYASDPVSFSTTVAPAPKMTLTAPTAQSAFAGQSVAFKLGSLAVVNAKAPFKVSINWGDGTASQLSMSAAGTIPATSHTFAKAGTFTVTVGASDAASVTAASVGFQVTVAPAPVTTLKLTPPASQTAGSGVAKTFQLGSLIATNAKSPFKATITWGDGTAASTVSFAVAGAIPALSHTYAKAGSFTAGVTVADAAGHLSNRITFAVTVAATGTISGKVFNDANGDGLLNNGEVGIGKWKVYLDLDKSGTLTAADRSTLTDVNGKYSFGGLLTNTYNIRVVPVTGVKPTKPVNNLLTVKLGAGQLSMNNLFGERAI